MTNSEVPTVQLNTDGTISLVVDVYGFDEGTPIEISGQATQENGAVASFYSFLEMPKHESGKSAPVTLHDIPISSPQKKFVAGFSITVVARAAEAWITTLAGVENDSDNPTITTEIAINSNTLRAIWKSKGYSPAMSASVKASPSEEPSSSTTLLHHGTWWDQRRDDPLYAAMEGRFTRLFPYAPTARFDECDLKKLACAMIAPEEPEQEAEDDDPEENQAIPAAYTYLGQFVDHDLTFDPISHLREALTPAQFQALVDFRTPRFDLDSLYGRGPDDQPYMYDDDRIYLLPGKSLSGKPFDPGAVDLPRGPRDRALIGDPRNDENRIVAQLHAIFLRFHNEVVRTLGGKGHVSFKEVRDQVRWHYQWVLVDDFLRTILNEETYNSVFLDNYDFVTTIPRLRENDLELMPVEFSVAAYRFGHSMVRPRYRLNPKIKRPIPIFSDHPDDFTADLGGFRPIPPDWAIDWQFFIKLGHNAEHEPQLSYKIDSSLVYPLSKLPERVAKDPSNLALRNLQRGLTFQLPSGQDVARALGMPLLDDGDLMIGMATTEGPQKPIAEVGHGFAGNAPLWVYILSEAQATSWKKPHPGLAQDKVPIKLGPVGGRLVAEVFASILRGDPTSYVNAKNRFKPFPEFSHGRTFGLAELINVALGHTSLSRRRRPSAPGAAGGLSQQCPQRPAAD
jgi:Animal haem peroxidase